MGRRGSQIWEGAGRGAICRRYGSATGRVYSAALGELLHSYAEGGLFLRCIKQFQAKVRCNPVRSVCEPGQ